MGKPKSIIKDCDNEEIPINCQICECFLEDDNFIKEHGSKFVCGSNDEINPIFIGDNCECEDFKIGKWHLVEFLKRLSGE